MASYPMISGILKILLVTNVFGARGQTTAPYISWNVTVVPEFVTTILEGQTINITARINFIGDVDSVTDSSKLVLHLENLDRGVFNLISNETFALTENILSQEETLLIEIEGRRVGKSPFDLTIYDSSGVNQGLNFTENYDVHCLLSEGILDAIFQYGVLVGTVLNTLAFACCLDLQQIKLVFRRPIALTIGFVLQYGMLPPLAYGLGKAFALSPAMAFGLFCLSTCPGGGPSNMWTLLLRGDIDLSISMTCVSTLASFGMMPLWLFTLGRALMDDVRRELPGTADDITIPFLNIVLTLALVFIPCIIGLLISKYLPKAGKILAKIVKPIALIVVLFQLILGIITRDYVFAFLGDWRLTLSCLLLPYTAQLISFSVAMIARQGMKKSRTIMIETSVQNSALAIAVVLTALPRPDADLAIAAPLICMFANPIPFIFTLIGFGIRRCHRRCKGKKAEQKEINSDKENNDKPNIALGAAKRDSDLEKDFADMKYLTNSPNFSEDGKDYSNNNGVYLIRNDARACDDHQNGTINRANVI